MLVGSVLVGDIPPVTEAGCPTNRRSEISDVVISGQNVEHVPLEPTPIGAKPLHRPPPQETNVQLHFSGGMVGHTGPELTELRDSLSAGVQKDLLPVGVSVVNGGFADAGSQ